MSQFAVYRVKDQAKAPWQLSYFEVLEQKIPIRDQDYMQIYLKNAKEWKNAMEIWKNLQDTIKISDILVINQNGEVSTYYTDADGPNKISGFFNLVSDGAVIAADTKDYQIEGYEGSWMVTDFLIMDGKQFYLMEHQRFHDQANKVILDSYGKLVTETGKAGFDEIAKQKIRDYGKEKKNQEPVKEDHQERIEHYQKMILQKKDARISGGMSINEQDQKSSESELEIPGKKKSIVGRLRRHQAEIAAKEGKPVSKYLEMQLAREKKN